MEKKQLGNYEICEWRKRSFPVKEEGYGKEEASCEGIGVHDKDKVIHALLHGCFAYSVDDNVQELY